MTREEVEHVKKVLEHIVDKNNPHVIRAVAICNKQLSVYAATKGQLKNYELEESRW